jgi:hypothetical protein
MGTPGLLMTSGLLATTQDGLALRVRVIVAGMLGSGPRFRMVVFPEMLKEAFAVAVTGELTFVLATRRSLATGDGLGVGAGVGLGSGVGVSVGTGVGDGVGDGLGEGVGEGVGDGVATGVGVGGAVGEAVTTGVKAGVRTGVEGVGVGVLVAKGVFTGGRMHFLQASSNCLNASCGLSRYSRMMSAALGQGCFQCPDEDSGPSRKTPPSTAAPAIRSSILPRITPLLTRIETPVYLTCYGVR